MINGMAINAGFEALTNTDFWEQYQLNAFQFSAAKSRAEMKMLQNQVFDENKKKRTYEEFREACNPILTTLDTWWRVEYDLASRGAVLADQWQQIWKDRDINPYATYHTRGDARVRPEHATLNGIRFRIDSPIAKNLYVPNGWNCRCDWETDNYEGKLKSDDELEKLLTGKTNISNNPLKPKYVDNVPFEFRNNVGIDGIFPSKKHSYFEVLPNANDANYTMFGASKTNDYIELNTTIYEPYQVLLAIEDWQKVQPTRERKELLFRNHEWKLNVFMNTESVQKIAKKTRGIENIKTAIEHPDELWGRWANVDNQKVVVMNYIIFQKNSAYIVETKGGIVQDAYFRQHSDSKNLRRLGIKFLK
jgi:SPP1 gp7 family putative phage head morphogenesis protein